MTLLNPDNYSQGFLIDHELMAGVSQHPENPDTFVAFVLHHTTGEYLGYQPFSKLDEALNAINQIQRTWSFERLGGGCGGKCGKGEGGKCASGKCGAMAGVTPTTCEAGACAPPQTPQSSQSP